MVPTPALPVSILHRQTLGHDRSPQRRLARFDEPTKTIAGQEGRIEALAILYIDFGSI